LLVLLLFTEYLLSFFTYDKNLDYVFIARVLICTVFLEIVFSHINSLLLMSGYHNSVQKVFLFNTILAIFFMFFLTYYYGLIGSSVAFFINFLIKNLSLFYIYKKNIN